MILRTAGIALLGLAAIAAVGAWIASSHGLPSDLLGDDERAARRADEPNRRAARRSASAAGAAKRGRAPRGAESGESRARDAESSFEIGELPGAVWRMARAPLAISGVLGIGLLLSRWRARGRRRYARLHILPFRADEAQAADVMRLLESWHQHLLERWWRRIPLGQPGIALELFCTPDAEGQRAITLSLVCPERLVRAVEGGLLGCYPDARLVPTLEPVPDCERVIRLKKRHHFVRALQAPGKDDPSLVDSLLNQMASLEEDVIVQYTLIPTPALFDRYSRWRFASKERSSEWARANDPGDPGLRSEVLGQELEGGLRVQHRPLFFTEIRIAAQTYAGCRAAAGAIRGDSGAENRLVERQIRSWARGGLYRRRIQAGTGNPIPGWRKSVLSSVELAGLWQFPGPGLKRVRIERSPLPRMPAMPEVSRRPEHTLMHDEYGAVGIRPEDKTDGLGLIGGQKTGKTSVLCRTVQADALDPECALVVLMPKPGDALKALSMVPKQRTVHYLDLERPEFGINPLAAPGDPSMVADKIVDAFRDVNMEGDIRGSSDRYLRQAAQAAIGATRTGVLDGPPTLWHMYRILVPAERAFRERVVESLFMDPRFTDTATFFGVELPNDLENSPGQTTAKLDAPRNKLLRLMVESLDKVLRHPLQLSLDDIVRDREVLVVDGKMGTFGADNCRVMMQFILSALYGALRRQQEMDESERVRVALKVDEAHLILNESFADAMATLRSGGLEVVAAWQYGEQIQDPKIRGGMMSLLRQRCMFSMGEKEDARELSSLAMAVYSDMIRDDPESRSRMRVTPDTIFNLPNHHAVCSWISRGARAPAFMGQTLPLEHDEDVVMHHAERQRERGGHVPERLPDPLPDLDWKGMRELPSEEIYKAPSANGPSPAAESTEGGDEPAVASGLGLDFDPAATSVEAGNARPGKEPPQGLPETFTELDLESVRGLVWDKVTPLPADRIGEPSGRDLEILAALWSYRFLFAGQIHRRWARGDSLRTTQRALGSLAKAGWVRRFRFQLAERGAQQRVYCLTRQGFELAQQHAGRRGSYIDPDLKWREPVVSDAGRILRSLHVNGWVLAFEAHTGKLMRGWRGGRQGRLEPPRRRVRGEWKDLAPQNIVIGASHKLRDYEPHKFEPVSPDATLELRIPTGESALRFDLLVEIDRAGSAARSEDRLRRYDGLISGWSGMLERYKTLGTPPMVVFVCEDERSAMNLVRIADRTVTARLAKAGSEETEWPHPGRRAIFFAIERDIHTGSLAALQLPDHPPEVRERLEGKRARPCRPKRVHIVEPRLIEWG